ncbi:hypothetical protein TWF703_002646 [Orbilia oligospora]|uniref:Uncharacterized protein n=1 Tax=Orbilia oligospora TaxID=2813651 RepID=A0A7C8JFI8_ORBOL|nr:hypothetical protein TWF703_002646 [Orbilia oligospora]
MGPELSPICPFVQLLSPTQNIQQNAPIPVLGNSPQDHQATSATTPHLGFLHIPHTPEADCSAPSNSHAQADGSNLTEGIHHEMPKMSWKDLGASRTVKIVVIIALSIVGTMETIFYVKLFMRKFFPREENPVEDGEPAVEDAKST